MAQFVHGERAALVALTVADAQHACVEVEVVRRAMEGSLLVQLEVSRRRCNPMARLEIGVRGERLPSRIRLAAPLLSRCGASLSLRSTTLQPGLRSSRTETPARII